MIKTRHFKFFIVVASLIIIILVILPLAWAQKSDAYDFTSVTTKSDWKYISYVEKVKRCQIPEKKLSQMSTEGLVETCLNYPLYGVITTFNYLQHGFNQISFEFNGFQELFKRKDVAQILVGRYKSMNPMSIEDTWTKLERGKFKADFFYIEFLLAQDEIISNLNGEEVDSLLENCLGKIRAKQNAGFSSFYMQFTPLIMGKVLNLKYNEFTAIRAKNNQIEAFFNTGVMNDSQVAEDILYATDEYLKTKK